MQIKALKSFRGKLYASTIYYLGDEVFRPLIYEFDGNKWKIVAGNEVYNSWPDFKFKSRVNAFAVYKGKLYAGLAGSRKGVSGSVWSFDGNTWKNVSGDLLGGTIYTLEVFKGKLYAGTATEYDVGPALIFEFNGKDWNVVGGGGVGNSWHLDAGFNAIYQIKAHGDFLYISTSSPRTSWSGTVWRWDGRTWEQVGGKGIRNFVDGSKKPVNYVETLEVYRGSVVAGLQRHPSPQNTTSSVKSYQDGEWREVGIGIPKEWNKLTIFNYLYSFNGRLYLGAGGDRRGGTVSLYELEHGSKWKKVGGAGIKGSWNYSKDKTLGWIYKITSFGDKLCVAIHRDWHREAEVWCY